MVLKIVKTFGTHSINMSKYDYDCSKEISSNSFYAIIMVAMRKADSQNLTILKKYWPEIWNELQLRYNSPNGIIEGEDFKSEFESFHGDKGY